MATVKSTFGDRIRKARKQKGWRQADLAREVEVTAEYISHIESNRRIPAVEVAMSIARALDLEPRELVHLALAHQHPSAKPFLGDSSESASREPRVVRLQVIVERDKESDLWVTYVPALGHLSTYGQSKREALLQTREAIRGYFEAAEKEEIAVPIQDVPVEVVPLEVSLP